MERTIVGKHYKDKSTIGIGLLNGYIKSISKYPRKEELEMVGPGFVDLQINGFNGVDFNQGGLSPGQVVKLTKDLWSEGVTTYYPTLITNDTVKIHAAIKCIIKACENPLVADSIGGIHLEGPFLSKKDGPRGAHPLNFVQAPNWNLFCEWQNTAKGRIKLITISPEWPDSGKFIDKCVSSGVKVAIGHTAASEEQIAEAVQAGAIMSTHLGNATHLTLPRHSNYIWDQLANENLWCSLIADGFHLPVSILKVFLKVKNTKSVLVSDSTKFAGLPPGIYNSHIGGDIELTKNGRLQIINRPEMLAGSAKTLRWCIEHLVNNEITSLEYALEMASLKPIEVMEISNGFETNKKADLIVFEYVKGNLKILKTIKSGEVVYEYP
ncbi:N-acetylglucosamine-6-phosphate deacetylase [Salegentibacter salegens]|uniref:N-acetylglucosamine-6-phosphate deacetylase n=1 Tax=Salegentibacter salegens TaxID=143223 RepID=A0A1M7MFH2_9FLAO|nr:amidohydrolase family protein [Salegentibacter salegens]PRX51639.1 N-acetylglucosamine-6-phosphate deacetylase [Salegentibacter salegens]SHM89126.1 N-acetylglucosamine-6-phosphate deacetylase [Salegentibacter salegens]